MWHSYGTARHTMPGAKNQVLRESHWDSRGRPVETSRAIRTSTATMAILPFQVSALLVQPHFQAATGGGSTRLARS